MFSQYKWRLPWLKNEVIMVTTTTIISTNKKLEYIHPGICYVSVQFIKCYCQAQDSVKKQSKIKV